jgi:NAD(P)-dependent dehydrogenase (short-subunit alcohol dehydrogenase family)
MILHDKVAVVYGGAGSIGSVVARAFANEGAKVFLTGRQGATVQAVAQAIGAVDAAEVDALDEEAVDAHLTAVVEHAGRVDISFNAVGLPNADVVGVPLIDLDLDRFTHPMVAYATSYFLTARLAARRMVPNKSGVIMTLTALPARRGTRFNGAYGAASAAKEQLTRDLSCELAPHGVRVVGLRPHGIPESRTMREIFDAKPTGMSWDDFQRYLANTTHPGRVMRVEEVAHMAAFMASDRASGMTGTTVNLTMGSLDD